MSDYIVLVKQVPDVSQITDNAFNPETGTLIRARLASVINELDAQALAFANNMKNISADTNARIIALTMGPPMAEEVLRYSLARTADTAILLTDRKLGGADTWATANPLAFAIRKIVKEILNNSDDYYIVSGMQSVDGDTAQVPAQIAEELNLPCVAYATDAAARNGSFSFQGIISGGSQTVSPKQKPAVITVAKYEYPLFATFSRTRKAEQMQIHQWTADDVNATGIGVSGSKTRVIRVFPPGKTTRKCQQVSDPKQMAELIAQANSSADAAQQAADSDKPDYLLPANRADKLDRSYEGTEKESQDFQILIEKLKELNIEDVDSITEQQHEQILQAAGEHFHKKALEDMLNGLKTSTPAYQGPVWVVAEHQGPNMHPATFELTGKARHLADSLQTSVGVVVAGDSVKQFSEQLIHAGADEVHIIEHPLLEKFDPKSYKKAICEVIEKHWPQIVLFAATPRGRALAPMISYALDCGLTADCTSLDIRDSSRKGQIAVLMQTRPALGGNVMATICTKDSRSQMATARPGVMKRLPPDTSRTGKVTEYTVQLSENDLSLDIIKTELGEGDINLAAEVVVSGGKGMQNRDNYESLLNTLTTAMRKKLNCQIERGASRAAVEQGFVDRVHQVGQTGTSIGPKIYVALGISGAIQHMIGVANSETIFAINSDPNAPIFKQCDYYMVANVEEAIPAIADNLQKI